MSSFLEEEGRQLPGELHQRGVDCRSMIGGEKEGFCTLVGGAANDHGSKGTRSAGEQGDSAQEGGIVVAGVTR